MAGLEHTLSREERRQLAEADVRLATHAADFLAELSRFVDLAAERGRLRIPSSNWWWYMDVLVQVPAMPMGEPKPELVVA